jgi:hypothetical protein
MLKHAGMPNSFWADAVKVAVYIKNRLPTRALSDTTPFEAWHQKATGDQQQLQARPFTSLSIRFSSLRLDLTCDTEEAR